MICPLYTASGKIHFSTSCGSDETSVTATYSLLEANLYTSTVSFFWACKIEDNACFVSCVSGNLQFFLVGMFQQQKLC